MSETEVARNDPVFNPEGMRVLAIDDNVVCLRFLVCLLTKCKYRETTKADEALEILRESKEKYDLVITDVIRLDMDGFRLLEIVSLEMDIPVVFVTAEDNQSSIMKGIMHGATDYLLKPVRIQEIKNIWQHVVRKRLSTIEKSSITRDIINSKESRPSNKLKEKVIIKNEDEDDEANSRSSCQKKPRLKWSLELHRRFVNAVQQLGDVNLQLREVFRFVRIPNACFNTPPQAPGQASVQIGTVLQHAIATGHAQNSFSGRGGGGYFFNQTSNSRGQLNVYPNNVQYLTQMDLMKNNERTCVKHPSEKSQHIQSSSQRHYSSTPSDDDLTELVKQFGNDEPPKL
ncbi:hypothetical protein QYF36_024579 [Acer negundo]|nr:hypothetical protein QYF36_024579 [Acer negundo]